MQLKEFIDKNGNQVKIPKVNNSSGASNKTSSGYLSRLRRLIDYHIANKDKDVDKILKCDVRNFGLDYEEHHKGQFEGGYNKEVAIRISDTENWYFTVTLDNKLIANESGKGWDKLVYALTYHLSLPQWTQDPEYQDLLKEFVDAKGNKVNLNRTSSNALVTTKTNKEKFEELVAYMDRYKDIYTTKTDAEWIKDTGFKYVMTRKSPGVKEYTITLELTYSRFNSSWQFETYRNYDYVEDDAGQGWKELLKALSRSEFGLYTTIPAYGSKEYDSLCESAFSSIAEDFKIYENLWD